MPKGIWKRSRPLVEERFFMKVIKNKSGCWGWRASVTTKGYAAFAHVDSLGRKQYTGTRFSYFYHSGNPIPVGMCVLHKCDNPKCTNPKHLFLGTQKENIRDCWKKGRSGQQKYGNWLKPAPTKTHCKYGHPFSGKNLRIKITKRNPMGEKRCVVCETKSKKECDARYYTKNRERLIEYQKSYRNKRITECLRVNKS